ncbi:MAG: hypothetical protein HOE96_10955 [Candidatus Marinimicrobia bacterium]|nr:hypothetical protein [Candidatus Neomarinimicrobiota bacterium]
MFSIQHKFSQVCAGYFIRWILVMKTKCISLFVSLLLFSGCGNQVLTEIDEATISRQCLRYFTTLRAAPRDNPNHVTKIKDLKEFIDPQLYGMLEPDALEITNVPPDQVGILMFSYCESPKEVSADGYVNMNELTVKTLSPQTDNVARIVMSDGHFNLSFPMKKINDQWLFTYGRATIERIQQSSRERLQ